MSDTLIVEGGSPLVGTVTVPGAKNSALKLIFAALFVNEDVILDNVPNIRAIQAELDLITFLGGTAQWLGSNRLLINASGLNSYELPFELGTRYRTALLFAGPLLFRFGKAKLPKLKHSDNVVRPVNRIIDGWKALGIQVTESKYYYTLSVDGSLKAATINFKSSSHISTDSAILSSLFVEGVTTINNASEESEIDDLVMFCNEIGGEVKRVDPTTIQVTGKHVFKGARFEVQPDKTEAAIFATAALLTNGNLIIKKTRRDTMIPFVNFLNKLGARYELLDEELRVWRNNIKFEPVSLNITPTPGFVPDWAPLAALLLTQAEGESTIHDTVYTDRLGFTKDLNRMGANIEVLTPGQVGKIPVISSDAYDFGKSGEPETVAKITGPVKLKAERLVIDNYRYGPVLLLAALCAEGKSDIVGIENLEEYSENLLDRLISAGAKIWKTQG